MAGTSIIQIVARGKQNLFIDENPEVTLFRKDWKRITAFCIESQELSFNGVANFGSRAVLNISRNADMLWKLYLQVTLPQITASAGNTVQWTREVGHALIKEVTLYIGSQPFDRHQGELYSIWNELTLPKGHEDSYNYLIGNDAAMTTASSVGGSIPERTIYVPLQFWFCRNFGASLPLIALSYSEVKLEFEFRHLSELVEGTLASSPSIVRASVWADYIFLDEAERRNLAQNPQQYLIDVFQFNNVSSVSNSNHKERLTFNHPTKFITWVVRKDSSLSASRVLDFTDATTPYDGDHTVSQVGLKLNSQDRFSPRDAVTFNIIQPYQHFPRSPRRGIYVYSFARSPVDSQPSGTLNFSRIDNVVLEMTLTTGSDPVQVLIFAFSYNIARMRGGQGGIAFAS